jgi:3-hydroxymyristoyl/3-hydroxydecanoyl-(acyl carrier protein) dehydratase
LIAEGVVIDLTQLLGDDSPKPTISRNELVRVKIGGDAFAIPPSPERRVVTPIAPSVSPAIATLVVASQANIAPSVSPPAQASTTPMTTTMHQADPILAKVRTTVAANGEAHGAYLAFSSRLAEVIAGSLTNPPLTSQTLVPQVSPVLDPAVSTTRVPFNHDPAFMNREQCLNYAVGRIGDVLGSAFAPIDAYPTRVRLPDEPLMLVDRIMTVTGEPLSMTCGEVVTEHDILEDSWYLDANKIPICIAVEAGQADLFLSGYLGIDLQTHGLAVYRLLDARVTFHRELPGPGKIIHYEIQIERFFIHDDTYFFRFQFDATVDGELLLTMRDGCAGFFTDAALAAGKGVILTTLDRQAGPKIGQGWDALVPIGRESYSEAQIESLRQGDLTAAFGADFAHLPLARPLTIPGGRMKLIDRVLELEPSGGRHGLGFLRAEADIVPDAWFLTCHFVDDQVMPGTLMFECGQHALRVLLMRLGCVGEAGKVAWEPVPGRSSRLECRGQVTATTKKVHYDITIKELGYKPEPYAVADVIMYADSKAIVRVEGMAIQLSGTTRDELCAIWTHQADEPSPKALPLYDSSRILAYAIGKPSEGFGDRYTIFDEGRIIARLPGPPYLFVDRVMKLNGEPWVMNPGTTVQTEYDVPADAWYFQDDRNGLMPFAVLLEVALQPCGWLAAYMGSALLSPVDVHFRNLGGQAVLHVPVTSDIGTLTVQIKLTQASNSGGMILQHFDMHVLQGTRSIYKGTTYFGFFPDAALAQQVGIREATPYVPSPDEVARGIAFEYPAEAPFPDIMLRMVDQVTLYVPDGGPAGLGFIRGTKDVVASEWFFKAHFYQDPVCPGSLGLESFLQLLKVIAHERWSHGQVGLFESIASEAPHRWTYRGQILPTDRLVTIEAVVTKIDDERQRITADGFLSIDGRNIYQMNDFTIAYHTRVQ